MTVIHGIEHHIQRPYMDIQIQEGAIKENGVNGCQVDDVLQVVVDIVTAFQVAFPCTENILALKGLNDAQEAMISRKRNREMRGVEGLSKV